MAEQVATLPGPGGRTSIGAYPWRKWLNGRVWHLQRGTDYRVQTTAMRAYVYRVAKAWSVTVRTVSDPDGEGITIVAVTDLPAPQEER